MKQIFYSLAIVLTLGASSCSKWLDINDDPNSVTDVDNGLIIPSMELNLLNVYGFYGHMLGSFYAQQFAIKPGGPQYLGLSHWDIRDGTLGASFTNYFYQDAYTKVCNNAKTVQAQASADGEWGDYLAATVLRVFALQVVADGLGAAPYSQALDVSNLSPVYDSAKDIYSGLVSELNYALSKVSPSDKVCDNMTFSSSTDIDNWVKFANALKLRLLMRESAVVNVSAALAELIAEDNFPEADIFYGPEKWTNQAGLDNPVYSEAVRQRGDVSTGRTSEFCAHMAVTAAMNEVSDARVSAKFNPSAAYGTYEGSFIDEQMSKEIDAGYFGDKGQGTQENTYAEIKLAYNAPVYLLTVAETLFFIAEYYSSIAPDDSKAKAAYEAAIDASFATHKVSGSSDIYAPGAKYAWSAADAARLIGIQKWIALAGLNGFESWCELRRTGYPAFGPKTGKEIYAAWQAKADENVASGAANPTPTAADLVAAGVFVPGTIFTPVYVVGLPANTLLGHLPYAVSSRSTNSSAPAQKDPSEKIFWAK